MMGKRRLEAVGNGVMAIVIHHRARAATASAPPELPDHRIERVLADEQPGA